MIDELCHEDRGQTRHRQHKQLRLPRPKVFGFAIEARFVRIDMLVHEGGQTRFQLANLL